MLKKGAHVSANDLYFLRATNNLFVIGMDVAVANVSATLDRCFSDSVLRKPRVLQNTVSSSAKSGIHKLFEMLKKIINIARNVARIFVKYLGILGY
jgi:hypothetical protein